MFKKMFLISLLSAFSFNLNAETLENLIQRTKACKNNCPQSSEYLKQPQIMTQIIGSITASGYAAPNWLLSSKVISTPAKYETMFNEPSIHIKFCKSNSCSSNKLEGNYLIDIGQFIGDYTKNGKTDVVAISGP